MASAKQIQFFSDAGQFLERVQPFLLRREAEHCLILGLLGGLRAGDQWGAAPPLMGLVEEKGEVAAVALMTPPRNLILSWIADDSTIDSIVHELRARGIAIPGVNGSAEIAQKFVLKWSALSRCSYRVQMAQRIYQLTRVTNETRSAGHLREPEQSDEALLREWRAAFSIDAEGMDPIQAREDAALPMPPSRRMFLWELEGTPVAMAGFAGPTPNGIRVAWVYTPPKNRGNGFAGACVAALTQKLLDEGRKFCFLYTDLANPVSNHIYQTIGYEPVSDATVYSFS
ncbi:MAG TPA: GNAT family N-acetyltransferase [Candidatus Binatus sp.]|uniref:GNAT family N-acetyltransferase n=1 Tax=Candidatus Binatus sp. TaxID=2811406 RepID=UPI002F413EF5